MQGACVRVTLLSLMLFLLVIEILSDLICRADSWSLFQKLQVQATAHHTSFYADNLILFVRPVSSNHQLLWNILIYFKLLQAWGVICLSVS
jgi:hypothetical protein